METATFRAGNKGPSRLSLISPLVLRTLQARLLMLFALLPQGIIAEAFVLLIVIVAVAAWRERRAGRPF
jgi:hypothetical protein